MSENELIDKANQAVAELVYPKYELKKAYNYYHGKMDADQFRYLEENYGIGNPTSVEFIPLIKKHIDALVGEYLGMPILPKVTCKDTDTITKINREKELAISKKVYDFLKSRLKNKLLQFLDKKGDDALTDPTIQQDINSLIESTKHNFISQFEVAAQNVIQYLMQCRETDMLTKLKQLLLDLLISGYTYFKVKASPNNENVQIEVLDPLNTFIDKNPNSPYVKDSYRAVVRKWYTKTQILNIYGSKLSKEDRKLLEDSWQNNNDLNSYYVRTMSNANGTPATDGIRAGQEVVPGYPDMAQSHYNFHFIPVYEIEWLETDSKFVMQRYSVIRIGNGIFILNGKDENVVRSHDNPSYCSLSVNGVYFVNRNSEPYSLMTACMSLQDKYNILHFYRDNLIASSGSVGDWLDVSMLPSFLGTKLSERIEKWKAYKKAGTALIDSSQEGRIASGQSPINTLFNGYDDTIKVTAIQAIQTAIESVEATASSITGVFRERLNGIEQRDAVTNIKQGANNSFIITKQYYQQMDLVTNEILLDALNIAKRVYKNGLTGTYILGDRQQKIFTALPEYFTLTDYDVHISTTTDAIKDMEYIKQILPEFIKSQSLDPSIIFEAISSKSLTDLKNKVRESLEKRKQENNQIQQLSQQLEEIQNQLQQCNKELEKSQKTNKELEQAKLQLEQQKINLDFKIKQMEAETDKSYKNALISEQQKRTQIELEQLHDGDPYNDRIKQLGE